MTSENIQDLKDEQLNFPEIDISDLIKIIPNRFLLCSAIAKRSRQLTDGEKPLVDVIKEKPFNPISIAMKELLEEKFTVSLRDDVDDEVELIEKLDKSLDEKLEKQESKEAPSKGKDKKSKSKSLSTS